MKRNIRLHLDRKHPETLQDEKKATGQANTKTEREALRSKSTGQFHSPEKEIPKDVISHGVAVGPPGTKGSNSHRSPSWKEAKKSAEEKEAKKKAAEAEKNKATSSGDSHQATPINSSENNPNTSGVVPQAGPTLSVPNQIQLSKPKRPKATGASTAGNPSSEDLLDTLNEDLVRRSSRLKSANRTRKYGALIYD